MIVASVSLHASALILLTSGAPTGGTTYFLMLTIVFSLAGDSGKRA